MNFQDSFFETSSSSSDGEDVDTTARNSAGREAPYTARTCEAGVSVQYLNMSLAVPVQHRALASVGREDIYYHVCLSSGSWSMVVLCWMRERVVQMQLYRVTKVAYFQTVRTLQLLAAARRFSEGGGGVGVWG